MSLLLSSITLAAGPGSCKYPRDNKWKDNGTVITQCTNSGVEATGTCNNGSWDVSVSDTPCDPPGGISAGNGFGGGAGGSVSPTRKVLKRR